MIFGTYFVTNCVFLARYGAFDVKNGFATIYIFRSPNIILLAKNPASQKVHSFAEKLAQKQL